MLLLFDVVGAILFVLSSGLLFNKKYRENAYLVTLAGLLALAATYMLTKGIVGELVDERLAQASHPQPSSGGAPGNTNSASPAVPAGSNDGGSPTGQPGPTPTSGAIQATPTDIEGAQAYDRQDYATALRLLVPPANSGDPTAQYFVGVMTLRGYGTVRDPQKALELLRSSATAGIADAQNYMAMIYRRGEVAPLDYAEAMKWYQLAAKQGYKNAQYRIALLYRDGLGVAKSDETAYMWAVLASSEGDPTAGALKSKFEGVLSPSQIQTARQDASQWQSTQAAKHVISIYSLTRASP